MCERQARVLAREDPGRKVQAFLFKDGEILPRPRRLGLAAAVAQVPAAGTGGAAGRDIERFAHDGRAENCVACAAAGNQPVAVFVTNDSGWQLMRASEVGNAEVLKVMCDARWTQLQPVSCVGSAHLEQPRLAKRQGWEIAPSFKASPIRIGAQCVHGPLWINIQVSEQVNPTLGRLRDVHGLGIAERAVEASHAQQRHRGFERVDQRDAFEPAAKQFVHERRGQERDDQSARV